MILAVIDDLLFRSKISAAAKACGAPFRVATSADAALQLAGEERPSLIILDLDSRTTQPFDLLQRLSADPELARTPTVGFVSHVNTEVIRQARQLGIGSVLARSVFAASLPDILARHRPGASA